MSFALWNEKPPFGEAEMDKSGKWTGAGLNPGELIYFEQSPGVWVHFDAAKSSVPNGARFCVTTEGLPTQQMIDTKTTHATAPSDVQQLTDALVAKGVLTAQDVAALNQDATTP